MGRKPNPLVQDYFKRGQKLLDQSNRYAYTCLHCSEHFPKGRTDHLLGHLKVCKGISSEDRGKIEARIREKAANNNSSYGQMADSFRRENAKAFQHAAASNTSDEAAALHMLADATAGIDSDLAMQAGAGILSAPNVETALGEDIDSADAAGNVRKRKRGVGPHQYQSVVQIHSTPFESGVVGLPPTLADYETNEQLLQGINRFAVSQSSEVQGSSSTDPGMGQDQLALAATAATNMITNTDQNGVKKTKPAKRNPPNQILNKTQLPGIEVIDPQLEDATNAPNPAPEAQMASNTATSFVIPDAQFVYQGVFDSNGTEAKRKKSRASFNEERRVQVRVVRSMGACVRCKMLKKSCSQNTPCSACESVNSARLWKFPCMRRNLSESFHYFSTRAFSLRAHKAIEALDKPSFEQKGHLKVGHFLQDGVAPLDFDRKSGHSSFPSNIDPTIIPIDSQQDLGVDIEILDTNESDAVQKMSGYFQRVGPIFFSREPSDFMRITLVLANDLNNKNTDALLKDALELWTATHILVDTDAECMWTIHASDGPDVTNEDDQRVQVSPANNASSYRLITQQLHGYTERRAAALSKSLYAAIEHRLIQRTQAKDKHFETFLGVVILLNCMEKMRFQFAKFATNPTPSGGWVVPEKQPQEFIDAGDEIANFICMVVTTRGILPPFSVGGDGVLGTSLSDSPRPGAGPDSQGADLVSHLEQAAAATTATSANGSPRPSAGGEKKGAKGKAGAGKAQGKKESRVKGSYENSEKNQDVAAWFEWVGVTATQLQQAQAGEVVFDHLNSRCSELKYVASLLLSD